MNNLSLVFRTIRRVTTEFSLFFIRKLHGTKGLIISLTSYPAQLSHLHLLVRSLLRQTLPANQIILYFGADTKESDIPLSLKNLTKYTFEIKAGYENLKQHKKYFFAMKEFGKHIILTIKETRLYAQFFRSIAFPRILVNNVLRKGGSYA